MIFFFYISLSLILMQGLQTNYTLPNSINKLIMDDCHTVQYRGVIIIFMEHFKAGFHMIADDRRSQKVLRSFAIIWKHTSAIVCDRLRSCDRDRRRSQKIEPCSIFCDRLRSPAIVCDPAIIWNSNTFSYFRIFRRPRTLRVTLS